MNFTLVRATTLPVSLVEVKAHVRVDDTESDVVLVMMLDAAIEYVSERTARTLQPMTFQARLDDWPCLGGWRTSFWMKLDKFPIRDVEAISYLDVDGAEQTVAPSNYSWEPTTTGADIWFDKMYSMPSLEEDRRGAVRVRFTAGYNSPADNDTGADPDLVVPVQIKQAILLLVGHWFENREAVTIAANFSEVPLALETLVENMRIYR